jgi:hypothetical protein
MRFDLILATSVFHHINADTKECISELKKMSKFVIVEMASDDSGRAVKNKRYTENINGEILGEFDSHLDDKIKRKLILCN